MSKPPVLRSTRHARQTLRQLSELYPEAECALHHTSPWELLVATILSAQCTDVRVNLVTPALFARCPTPEVMSRIPLEELEQLIKTTGFFRNKAKNLQLCASALVEHHGGEVPGSMEELVELAGVGRKTANVILGNAFQLPGMVVDTHVKRLAYRLGWSAEREPEKVEVDLCRLLAKRDWTQASHLLIAHGRAICRAQRPWCSSCSLQSRCPRNGVKNSK
ncbi:MAG: endonuclease III [Desulfuromonas sp.]|nr:MAG: endonuclease III [Desulfuromonas sp.]